MARRRMFSLDIIDTDLFMEMPQSARLLYYELCMRADDDGFVGNPKKIQRMVNCSDDDFKVLASKKYIIPFESGIIVITHWKIHNYIQNDRYKETIYLKEKSQLNQEENGMYTTCIQNGYSLDTQDRLGKDSIDNMLFSNKEKSEIYKEIISYLNEKVKSNYKFSSKTTQKHINARLNEGFTVEDFKKVIDKKYDEWSKDSKMAQYLRPETLFGTKFEAYLNAPEGKKNNFKQGNYEQRKYVDYNQFYDNLGGM